MFKPNYIISSFIATCLMKIEALTKEIESLPLTPMVLATLRETAALQSTYYSTKIEGNRLTKKEVEEVLFKGERLRGKERDEKEILGYYEALSWLENLALTKKHLDEKMIKKLHALIMGGGRKTVTPTAYRDGQNVIKDGATGRIVYLPPEAADVSSLIKELIQWINHAVETGVPIPLIAAIFHYQFATIHPYYDGNGRTARLITTFLLHRYGYDLKGIYSLDAYYADNLTDYYGSLSVGSHNYYMGRADEDITPWISYFCIGVEKSFEHVKAQALKASKKGSKDQSRTLRKLDARQRTVLTIFKDQEVVTSRDIATILRIKPRTARALAQQWVEDGFLKVASLSKKTRSYSLAQVYNCFD
ncbi:Fic family protein [bacterium]|jgi:Fic family protein|nr:Fic family protein [bacterium]MBT5014813.1 Fic family protein [bacterium]